MGFWTKEQWEIYEHGYCNGESCREADFHYMLTALLDLPFDGDDMSVEDILKKLVDIANGNEPAVPEITMKMVVSAQNAMMDMGFGVEDAGACAYNIVRAALDAMLSAAPPAPTGDSDE